LQLDKFKGFIFGIEGVVQLIDKKEIDFCSWIVAKNGFGKGTHVSEMLLGCDGTDCRTVDHHIYICLSM
jgi:hypothetical protein